MNKSHHMKSRLVYIKDMSLYVTYVSDDGDSLIVALSVDLEKSHVMTDNARDFDSASGEISTKKGSISPSKAGPTTA